MKRNKGISFDFVLNRLPQAHSNIFVDASSSWGIGGCCGKHYFMIPWKDLRLAKKEIIARQELMACLTAVLCFGDLITGKLVTLYTDNDNAYWWLCKGRSSNLEGTRYLALYEYGKYCLECKITPGWIPSEANRTADCLSRGSIPEWVSRRGCRRTLSPHHWDLLFMDPITMWTKIIKIF